MVKPSLPPHRSHLFTVRLWQEDLGHGRVEWRGQMQHVLSGQTHYFRDWATLAEVMAAMLPGLEGSDLSAKGD